MMAVTKAPPMNKARMIVATGLFIQYCCTTILARQRVPYKKNCKVLVVQNRCEACQCKCGPTDCM